LITARAARSTRLASFASLRAAPPRDPAGDAWRLIALLERAV
jgi:hypothetical protein